MLRHNQGLYGYKPSRGGKGSANPFVSLDDEKISAEGRIPVPIRESNSHIEEQQRNILPAEGNLYLKSAEGLVRWNFRIFPRTVNGAAKI